MLLFYLFMATWIIITLVFGDSAGKSIYAFCVVAMFCSVAYAWLAGRIEDKTERAVLAIIIGVLFSALLIGIIAAFFYVVSLF